MKSTKKRIAITFDDGPSPNTMALCRLFSDAGAAATFFFMGENIPKDYRSAASIVENGCEIGNHTFSHRPLSYLTDDEITSELSRTGNMIYDSCGTAPTLARAPYGDLNDKACAVAERLGLSFIGWSLDTADWDHKDENKIYDIIIENAKDGDIILCHETYDSTLSAMKRVLPRLQELGFEPISVSELLDPEGLGLIPGKLYCKAEGGVSDEN